MSWGPRHNQVDIAFRGAKLLAELSGPLGKWAMSVNTEMLGSQEGKQAASDKL